MTDPHPLHDPELDGPLDSIAAFTKRAIDEPVPGVSPEFTRLELLVLAAALTSAVEYLVTHCLDKIFGKDIRQPNALQRAQLRWAYVRPAVALAIEANPDAATLTPAQRHEIENQVATKLLGAARSVTDVEWARMKMDARARGIG